jgi:hypothetical protein
MVKITARASVSSGRPHTSAITLRTRFYPWTVKKRPRRRVIASTRARVPVLTHPRGCELMRPRGLGMLRRCGFTGGS